MSKAMTVVKHELRELLPVLLSHGDFGAWALLLAPVVSRPVYGTD